MKAIVLAFLLAVCLCSDAVTRDFIQEVQEQVTWETTPYEENLFRGWTDDEVKSLLGAHDLKEPSLSIFSSLSPKYEPYPENFDPREKWEKCIHPVRNQANCGSCWAFGATSSFSDRFCIAGKDVILSPQDMMECDKTNNCCQGGNQDKAFEWLEKVGVVEDKCKTYNMNCGTCRSTSCEKFKCKKGSMWYGIDTENIKKALFTEGPVEASFRVYRDFMVYKSGVYYHKSGELVGGHAIELLGWGKEGALDYWLCKNSWGAVWGMKGYFKIKMGDCGIDDNMVSCLPEIKK